MSLVTARSRRELSRFLKFTVVGAIGFVVDITTFNVLLLLVGVDSFIARGLAFTAAIISNFTFNRYWTYTDSRSKPIQRQAAQFALVSLIGLLISLSVFALAEGPAQQLAQWLLDFFAASSSLSIDAATLGSNIAVMISVVVVLFWNFFINRFWTYSDVE